MSRCVVFCGPSLPVLTISRWLRGAEVRPPASRGDIYRATMQGAVAIGLIDGACDESGSVWHKELLWALKQGVFVYGAAGLGAIRAAELHRSGMLGVGRIFGWYRDGSIDADDEVMVAHGTRDTDYRVQSEALVNVRATLERAVGAWIISEADARTLIQVARTQFYPTRTFGSLLETAQAKRAVAVETIARLNDWLASGWDMRIDQKRIDAEAMVRRIASAAHDARSSATSIEFEYTQGWDALTRQIATEVSAIVLGEPRESADAAPVTGMDEPRSNDPVEAVACEAPRTRVLAKLRSESEPVVSIDRETGGDAAQVFDAIDRAAAESARGPDQPHADAQLLAALERTAPELARELLRECAERALALVLAQRHGLRAEPRDVKAASDRFRFEYGLLSDTQTEAWLAHRELEGERLRQWMGDDALIDEARESMRALALRQIRRVYEARVLAVNRQRKAPSRQTGT
jgi:hypothetical protein